MTSRVIPVAPFALVVFGATGDLSRRKLLPALFQRDLAGQLPEDAVIFGVSRGPYSRDAFIALAREAIADHVAADDITEPKLEQFLRRLHYLAVDADRDGGWAELSAALQPFRDHVTVFYLATSPELFGPICERIKKFGLAHENARVVVEKPIGKTLASARRVNDEVGAVFPEDRVYRIDHYLGKEAVQNLMALRFANVSVFDHARHYWPYLLALLVGLMLIICIPELSLFLPRSAGFNKQTASPQTPPLPLGEGVGGRGDSPEFRGTHRC